MDVSACNRRGSDAKAKSPPRPASCIQAGAWKPTLYTRRANAAPTARIGICKASQLNECKKSLVEDTLDRQSNPGAGRAMVAANSTFLTGQAPELRRLHARDDGADTSAAVHTTQHTRTSGIACRKNKRARPPRPRVRRSYRSAWGHRPCPRVAHYATGLAPNARVMRRGR